MDVSVLVFDRITALDAIGPYEVLGRIPGVTLRWVGVERGQVRTDQGLGVFLAETTIDEVERTDVLVVPGGQGTRSLLRDERVLGWVRDVHETTTWTTSVCTGSLVLAAAGILEGVDATTHWALREELAALGANPVPERVVRRGKVLTAAGVSAGIDMALTLAALVAGDDVARAIQLGIEYDPQPPFDAGSLERAPEGIVELVRTIQRAEDAGG